MARFTLPRDLHFGKNSLAELKNLQDKTTNELVDAYRDFCLGLCEQMNFPVNLRNYGITEDMFTRNVDRISRNTVMDACTGCNPCETSENDSENYTQRFTTVILLPSDFSMFFTRMCV